MEMCRSPTQLSLWVTEAPQGFRSWLKSFCLFVCFFKANKEHLFSRWPLQNRENCTSGSVCLKYKFFWAELLLSDTKQSIYMKKSHTQNKTKLPESSLACWFCNGPHWWLRRSICVWKSDRYKIKFLSKLSGWKHEDRVNVYFASLTGLLRLLLSTSALIFEYLVYTPN